MEEIRSPTLTDQSPVKLSSALPIVGSLMSALLTILAALLKSLIRVVSEFAVALGHQVAPTDRYGWPTGPVEVPRRPPAPSAPNTTLLGAAPSVGGRDGPPNRRHATIGLASPSST